MLSNKAGTAVHTCLPWFRANMQCLACDGASVADTPWGRLGLTICYDMRFPHLYRALAKAGAKLFTVPSAFTVPTGAAHWHILQRARAIEASAFVIAAAQVGQHQDGRATYGHSLVIDPWGDVLLDMGGEAAVLTRARADYDKGEYRWVAEAAKQVVFANPDNREAKLLLADALELLARVDRADVGVLVERVANAEVAEAHFQFAEDFVGDAFLNPQGAGDALQAREGGEGGLGGFDRGGGGFDLGGQRREFVAQQVEPAVHVGGGFGQTVGVQMDEAL